MRKIENWEEIRDFSEIASLPVGPQPCKITNVEDVTAKSYLKVEFEIVSGPFKGWYTSLQERTGNWYGTLNRSYKDAALGFFKAFITAVEKSNPGYKWDWNEKSLIGKYVVANYREEESVYNGELQTRVRPFEFRSVQAYKDGEIKEPAKKTLTEAEKKLLAPKTETMDVIEDELPF